MTKALATRVETPCQFAASIAHELSQPLAAISVNGDASLRWLGRDPLEVDEVRTAIARIVANARRATDIIARIRDIAARKDPQRRPVDLCEVVKETLKFLDFELQTRRIGLNLQLAENPQPVLGDGVQLRQVVLNLVMNAMQAMHDQTPDRRMLTVRVAECPNLVRVEVEDLGPGIPEDNRGRLFDAFFTTKADGIGLGLSICRSIIYQHGGEIVCEHLVTGTRFVFNVPTNNQRRVGQGSTDRCDANSSEQGSGATSKTDRTSPFTPLSG
jgi:two-component system sensor kinase FixL